MSQIFYFHPKNRGNDPFWRAYFSNGWGKTHRLVSVPPTFFFHVMFPWSSGAFWKGNFIASNHQYSGDTPPKTNMEPENGPLERRFLLEIISFRFQLLNFGGVLNFFTWFAGWIIFPSGNPRIGPTHSTPVEVDFVEKSRALTEVPGVARKREIVMWQFLNLGDVSQDDSFGVVCRFHFFLWIW